VPATDAAADLLAVEVGPCFTVPPAPDAGAQSPSLRAEVPLAPCPARRAAGGDFYCTTAEGCRVTYGDVEGGEPVPSRVTCAARGRCLYGVAATGEAVYATCPTLEVQPQVCENTFDLLQPPRSAFVCFAEGERCTVDGTAGQRFARYRRTVVGGVEATACPTPCEPFA
jgi:hypothetical protein